MRWVVVIFASRESPQVLNETIIAAEVAARGIASIEVLINGNAVLAEELKTRLVRLEKECFAQSQIRVWSIPVGDKSNAWNQYVHQIWSGEDLTFFVDGYVTLFPDAIQMLGDTVAADERALGGSGMPSVGRSAAKTRQALSSESGLHGNFCCIKGGTLRRMVEKQINLPIGLYRMDSLLGAMLCYDLDPGSNIWEDYRIVVNPKASWRTPCKRWWRAGDVSDYLKRVFRQAKGDLEKRAYRDLLAFRRLKAESMPRTACELVLEWAARCPSDFKSATVCRPLSWIAMEKIRNTEIFPITGLIPKLIFGNHQLYKTGSNLTFVSGDPA